VSSPSALVAAVALAVTLTRIGQAQTPRPRVPTTRAPMQGAAVGREDASSMLRLVLWTDGMPNVLVGLTAATGPGGSPLPDLAEVRARSQNQQPGRPPGVLLLEVEERSAAGQAVAQIDACKPPACAIEIDRLDPGGQVIVANRFSGGTKTQQSHTNTNEIEKVSFTYSKIVVSDLNAADSAVDDWTTAQ
jgi:hypothetical protein